MARRILVPMDGSAPGEDALDFAIETFPGGTLVLLNVFTRGPPVTDSDASDQFEDLRERRGESLREAIEGRRHDGDVELSVEIVRPGREIVAFAEEEDVDQIVMGSHGRDGTSRVLLGSVAENVVRRAPVPVTVVR